MSIARLTITLEGIEPAVSRTIEIPVCFRLDRVHVVIQAAMGWQDSHLYEFMAGGARWGLPDTASEFGPGTRPAAEATLAEVLAATGTASICYVYDFGDNWLHRIDARIVGNPVSDDPCPRLLDATGRCPPEDVGGLPGYETFLEAIANPNHPDHDELTEWAGAPFDPHDADAAKLRRNVSRLAERWYPGQN